MGGGRSPDAAQHEVMRCRAGAHIILVGPGSAVHRQGTLHRVRDTLLQKLQRFRSGPQTTPWTTKASISSLEYPNSVSTSVACWLNVGGTLRRLGLLR